MPRLTNYCGAWVRHGGWYPDRKIRLWSKGAGMWSTPQEGGMLHERWVPNGGVEVRALQSDLLHYSYHSTSDHLRQWAKFARLGAADAVRAGRGSSSIKPWARAAFQWFKQAVIQSGWRDGKAGLQVAKWSAYAAYWKWKMVRSEGPFSALSTHRCGSDGRVGRQCVVAADGRCAEGHDARGGGGLDLSALCRAHCHSIASRG